MRRPDSNQDDFIQIRPFLCSCVQPIRSDRITFRSSSTGKIFHKCASIKIPGPRKYTMHSPNKDLFSATLDSVVLVPSQTG